MAIVGRFKVKEVLGAFRIKMLGKDLWISFWIEKGEKEAIEDFFQKIKMLEPKEKRDGEIFLSESPTRDIPIIEVMSKKLGDKDFSYLSYPLSMRDVEVVFQKIKEVVEIEYKIEPFPWDDSFVKR